MKSEIGREGFRPAGAPPGSLVGTGVRDSPARGPFDRGYLFFARFARAFAGAAPAGLPAPARRAS